MLWSQELGHCKASSSIWICNKKYIFKSFLKSSTGLRQIYYHKLTLFTITTSIFCCRQDKAKLINSGKLNTINLLTSIFMVFVVLPDESCQILVRYRGILYSSHCQSLLPQNCSKRLVVAIHLFCNCHETETESQVFLYLINIWKTNNIIQRDEKADSEHCWQWSHCYMQHCCVLYFKWETPSLRWGSEDYGGNAVTLTITGAPQNKVSKMSAEQQLQEKHLCQFVSMFSQLQNNSQNITHGHTNK